MNNQILKALFGDSRAPDGSLAADNFLKWFGKGVLLDGAGGPMVLHHGTGNVGNILAKGFSHDFTGKGNDQLGPGWYFTTDRATAEGYTTRRMGDGKEKPGGESQPGVLDVFINLKNPLMTNDQDSWFDQLPDLNFHQARMMLMEAPGIRDPDSMLSNWGNLKEEGFEKVLRQAARDYAGPAHFTISQDFYRLQPEAFLRTLSKVTGHDGVVHSFGNGEKHVVAWQASQIKSKDSNNGLFDIKCNDLTDRTSPKVAAINRVLKRAKTAADLVERVKSLPHVSP